MSDNLIDIIHDLLSNIDIDSIDVGDIDFNHFVDHLNIHGIDLSSYSIEEIKDALDYALTSTQHYAFNDYSDYFQSFLENHDINIQNTKELFNGINDYSNNGIPMPEVDKKDLIAKGIQEITSAFYNKSSVQSTVSTLEYKVGSNLGHHIKNSNISFKGIEKLLELVNYNTQILVEKAIPSI